MSLLLTCTCHVSHFLRNHCSNWAKHSTSENKWCLTIKDSYNQWCLTIKDSYRGEESKLGL